MTRKKEERQEERQEEQGEAWQHTANNVIVWLEQKILHLEKRIMAQIDDLKAAITTLNADVDILIAAQKPQDLTGVITAVQAVDVKVKAAVPPPVPPVP